MAVITTLEPAPILEHVTELFVMTRGIASYWTLSPLESVVRHAKPVIAYPAGQVLVE